MTKAFSSFWTEMTEVYVFVFMSEKARSQLLSDQGKVFSLKQQNITDRGDTQN